MKIIKIMFLLAIFAFFHLTCLSNKNDIIEYNKIYNFINQGFGYQFDNKEVYGNDILKQYGNIINYNIDKNYDNRDYVIINFNLIKIYIYNNAYVEYFIDNQFDESVFKDFRIRSIDGKENIEYLYGVKFGMIFQDFINIFKEANDRQDNKEYYMIWHSQMNESIDDIYLENDIISFFSNERNMMSKRVDIYFKDNKINNITWIF